MTFDELDFGSRGNRMSGKQALVFFGNGYGASVIQGYGTYGSEHGLYELAVIRGEHGDWDLCYDTAITEDVIGHLAEHEITDLLKRIEEL